MSVTKRIWSAKWKIQIGTCMRLMAHGDMTHNSRRTNVVYARKTLIKTHKKRKHAICLWTSRILLDYFPQKCTDFDTFSIALFSKPKERHETFLCQDSCKQDTGMLSFNTKAYIRVSSFEMSNLKCMSRTNVLDYPCSIHSLTKNFLHYWETLKSSSSFVCFLTQLMRRLNPIRQAALFQILFHCFYRLFITRETSRARIPGFRSLTYKKMEPESKM